MKVSGLYEKVIQFNSTQNTVMFVFNTDESGNKKGYHANVICRAYPSSSKGSFVFVIVLLALVVAIVSVGAAFVVHRKKAQNNRQYQSMNNPTVSYSANATGGAALNVAFEPGNNESANTTELETELL
ncbi:hypothetical protein B9Z55_023228 [Caenorhabditis nigoni]|uniref:CUB domain-containing protein n=1 Tax=Caenorhabditis nigoni TaxID=1611254 RepID=A0A2G5SPC2_9PELO|nr:hypothetical protein B9Z55_023228 [Caenorhabditis nigoni]